MRVFMARCISGPCGKFALLSAPEIVEGAVEGVERVVAIVLQGDLGGVR
jgi:hypothetical protein